LTLGKRSSTCWISDWFTSLEIFVPNRELLSSIQLYNFSSLIGTGKFWLQFDGVSWSISLEVGEYGWNAVSSGGGRSPGDFAESSDLIAVLLLLLLLLLLLYEVVSG